MKTPALRLLIALVLPLLLLLSGCDSKSTGAAASSSATASTAVASASGTSAASTDSNSGTSLKPKVSATPNGPVDCNWLLSVNQTIPKTENGLTTNYTLTLVAQKSGGQDVYGAYKGAAYVNVSLDASNLSNEVMSVLGGFNMTAYSFDVSFSMTPYDIESYSSYGLKDGEPPLAPLVQYESMALISPMMTGSGTLNPSVSGAQGEHGGINQAAQGTAAIPMKITVNSGKVTVSVPSFNMGNSFSGTLLGTPVSSTDSKDYAQGLETIKAMVAKASDTAAASTGTSAADLMNQFKPE